jgi:hypothetical protein
MGSARNVAAWAHSPVHGRCRRRRRRARTRAGDNGFRPGPDRGAQTVVGASLGQRRLGRARVRRGDGAVGTAVGTPAPSPDSALKVCERRGCVGATQRRRAARRAWRRKWRLTGGPDSSTFSELNLLLDENSSK